MISFLSQIGGYIIIINNTIITITDEQGNVITWSSGGRVGFKGTKKSTPYAAQLAARAAAQEAYDAGMRKVEVIIKGTGPGREAAVPTAHPVIGPATASPADLGKSRWPEKPPPPGRSHSTAPCPVPGRRARWIR